MSRRYDLVVVGMGSGGILAASFAARIGLKVAAVERDRIGGDCLWTGCVPSKTLLASARVAHELRTADRWGLTPVEEPVDTTAICRRVRSVREAIAAAEDSPEHFARLGVDVVPGPARVVDAHAVEAAGRTLETRFILLCTGSRPSVPRLPGLAEAGFLTSETIFELERLPRSVVVIGGGPIGVELAQALARLGTRTAVLQRRSRLLPRDEPELAERLTAILRGEGVEVFLETAAARVAAANGLKVVEGTEDGRPRRWKAEEILVAAGRTPNVDGLGLEQAGVALGPAGVVVDRRMRTSVRSIYAAGDVTGRFHFTHAAANEAKAAVRNMFFPGWTRASPLVPWCTFTDPELAHVGLTAAEAVERFGVRRTGVHRIDLADSDRARAEGRAEGAIVLVTARGQAVGAHVLAPAAGETIHELALAVRDGKKLRALSSLVHVYPTFSTSIARLADREALARARRYGWLARARR